VNFSSCIEVHSHVIAFVGLDFFPREFALFIWANSEKGNFKM